MTTIVASATDGGRYVYPQERVKQAIRDWLNGSGRCMENAVAAFDHALVERRSSVEPIEYVFARRGLGESNDRYKVHASELATAVSRRCLAAARWSAEDVDLFITTSCTGIMIPSVDAVVAERLQMKESLRRLPITEHGCAAGAVALSHAHDHLLAHPTHRVLVVAVEIPSLTFQPTDQSASNVISSALFGDGAAAVALEGRARPGFPRIVSTGSHRFRDSLDWMGFDLKDSGLHIVLSREVPVRIREGARAVIGEFLTGSKLALTDIDHFLLHPGGGKILQAFEETLALPEGALAVSRTVLREHGNLSSATVLFILQEYLERRLAACGDLGLMMAFGPGFGAEMLLLEWD